MFCSIARSPRLSRVAVAPAKNHRFLSMTCTQSVNKLYQILEEYRAKNFSEEYPKRFRKDIVKAATVNNRQRKVVLVKPLPPSQPFVAVSAEGIENVLQNIGMGHRISRAELDEIVSEVGGDVTIRAGERQSVISANQMFNLINRDESQMAAIRTA